MARLETSRERVQRVPIWRLRAAARAPRAFLLLAVAVLAALGIKALLTPTERWTPVTAGAPAGELGAVAFAELFARAYLTWNTDAADERDEALSHFMPAEVAGGADDTGRRDQTVLWTVPVSDRPAGPDRRVVTVAAQTSSSLVHLAVTVARDARGFLAVPTPPAVVGPAAAPATLDSESELDIEEPELRAVSRRVVTNYLARERENLAADLEPGAIVSLPDLPLEVVAIDGVTWVTPARRVAVAVTAAGPGGVRLALRYELVVARTAGRWLVRTVHVNPTARESSG